MNQTESCRQHDAQKKDLEMAFAPIYSVMFLLSVILNSLLLYVVSKKEHFLHEKRAFYKLFQVLISLDLLISVLILPQILVKLLTDDQHVSMTLDAFLAVRDYAISSQMVILVLIAVDRLLAFVLPLGNCWRLDNVKKVIVVILTVIATLYILRFTLLSVHILCSTQKVIDGIAKKIIGISGGLLMLSTFIMYFILFVLLCKRQVKRQQETLSSHRFLKSMQLQKTDNGQGMIIAPSPSRPRSLSRLSATKNTLTKRIGSIKFAKVLFCVNILMITSYLPGILFNAGMIRFPSYTVYFLFYLHALGDPILFFLTRPELKKGLISICKSRNSLL